MLALEARAPGSQAVALPADAPLRQALRGRVRVVPIPFRAAIRGTASLGRAIRQISPDVIAAHTSHAHSHAVRVAGGRAVIVHRRVDFAPRQNPLSRLTYRAATGYIAVSAAVADVLRRWGIPAEKVVVVHDGVDSSAIDAARPDRDGLRRELGVPPHQRLILAVGALVPHKGHRYLIDALEGADTTCLIAGEGPLRARLARRAALRGVDLRLLGQRTDIPRLLKSVHVFCHPSVDEGLGQVVIEAVLAAVPMAVTRAGGIPEVLGDGVPPGNALALAARLRDPRRFTSRERDDVRKRFSVASTAEQARLAYQQWTPRR